MQCCHKWEKLISVLRYLEQTITHKTEGVAKKTPHLFLLQFFFLKESVILQIVKRFIVCDL